MVKNKIAIIVFILAVVVVGFFLFRYFFPNDERQITRLLRDLAEETSFERTSTSGGQLAAARSAERVAAYFSEDAIIKLEDIDGVAWSLDGRAALRAKLLGARAALALLTVGMSDFNIVLTKPALGEATVTVQARWRRIDGFESTLGAREFVFTLRKLERHWLITRAESAPVIRRY